MNDGGYFEEAFPNGMPANCNIDKSIPGNRMTSFALEQHEGHLILMNPQVNTIDLKEKWCKGKSINVLRVNSDQDESKRTTDEEIQAFLASNLPNQRILVTPESLGRIVKAARHNKTLFALYRNYFCLVDESHCLASEKFRENIINAMNYIFKFDKKTFGSATPFDYGHPGIASLKPIKLVYPNAYRHVKIISCKHAVETLVQFLNNRIYPGNVHIFLNSVTEIGKVIRLLNTKDIKVHCVDEEKNELNLVENKHLLTMSVDGEPVKLNFYTCRYAEGWDLIDGSDATLIFVTDKRIPHSMLSVSIKGVQCIGRLRDVVPHEIFHITNNHGLDEKEILSIAKIKQDATNRAIKHVQYYNAFHADEDFDKELYKLVRPYIYRSNRNIKVLNKITIDQHIYEELTRREYANISTIEAAWHSRNITTETIFYDLPRIDLNEAADMEANKTILEILVKCANEPQQYRYEEAESAFKRLMNKHKTLIQCYQMFGEDIVTDLKFNNTAMKHKLVEHNNSLAKARITSELDSEYNINDNLIKATITERLQSLYAKYEYLDKLGTIKKAKASQLKEFGFDIKPGKTKEINGKRDNTFIITAKSFNISKVA
jgi:hypothetical protein